ncbi:MAG: hypothetical protein EXR69_11370 [Myxococcales bacterium]|nr:hypothetical protein [Myxococcales bacterium]
MNALISLLNMVFDVILAPFGHRFASFDLIVWPVLAGVIALLVYKKVSNQKGIAAAKNGIQVHLLEIVLYRDNLAGVLVATANAMKQNALYLGNNIGPMLVMMPPMTAVLVEIVANYAYSPLPVDATPLLEVKMAEGASVKSMDVTLDLPAGLSVDAGPVATPDGMVAWRLKAETAGDYVVTVHAGTEAQQKGLAFGGEPRKIPVLRTNTWESILYPGEDALPSDSAFETIRTHYSDRDLPYFPDGEGGILLWFFGFSLAAGFALKGPLGVEL